MIRNKFLTFLVAAVASVPSPGAVRTAFLPTRDDSLADVVEKSRPGVVRVVSASSDARGKAVGEGSGVILSPDGYLLTNRHVVDGAGKILVQLDDDRELPAKLVAADMPTDIAVLKMDVSGLRAIPFADSSRVRVGDYALAIGNPFGVGTTVSLGIVSAKGENDYIQTDAAINPGNSGGPLLDTKGEVIGINTAIVSPSGGSNGVGFALPSNLARYVAAELIAKGRVDRGYLGVGLQPLTESLQEALGVARGSALVADVAPDSPAGKAGLQKGDVIVAINGRVMRNFWRLQLYAAQAKPNSLLQVTVARQDSEITLPVTLAERPAETGTAVQEEIFPGALVTEVAASGEGPVVMGVDPRGVSAEAGLRPGDVIVAVDRKPVSGIAGLRERLASNNGKAVLLEISRGGSTYFIALPRS